MKRFANRFLSGIDAVVHYCAVWMGAVLTYLIVMDNETDWWFKVITIVFLATMFLLGFFKTDDKEGE